MSLNALKFGPSESLVPTVDPLLSSKFKVFLMDEGDLEVSSLLNSPSLLAYGYFLESSSIRFFCYIFFR